jgi:site-specific DNA recombinase
MKQAVIYARVSSREQEREGYSIPAQQRLLRNYAESNGIRIVRQFVDVETAKTTGRKEFGEMLRFFSENPECRIVLVEKTDRLYRNFRDSITFEDLKVEIHLVKEGQIISENSKSQTKLIHGFHVLLARNYSENLKEEVKKGMREKAEQGIFPGKAPFGYRNNSALRSIEIHTERAPIANRLFQLYASGNYSLASLRDLIRVESGITLSKAYLEKLLKNRFYIGFFMWQGIEYKGTHPAIVNPGTFREVQAVFSGHNKPKYGKHNFAFAGLLRCAHDGCTVTTELQKKKYVYYRCSYGRGKCSLPYMREQELSDQLIDVLREIHIPDDVLAQLVSSFENDSAATVLKRRQESQVLTQRLNALRNRIDQMYEDKLDGKIEEAFWNRKMQEWREQEQSLEYRIEALKQPLGANHTLDVKRILELANGACSLYVTQNHAERGSLLKSVLLNCQTDGVTLTPSYRKPFDLIFQRAKNQEWSGREDLNLRPPGPEPGALPG